MDEVKLSECAQDFWDYVYKMHEVTSRLIKSKEETLQDPNEDDVLFVFNAEFRSR